MSIAVFGSAWRTDQHKVSGSSITPCRSSAMPPRSRARDPSSIRATCWDWRAQVVRDLSAQYLQNRDFLEKQTSQRRAGEEQRTDAYQVLAPCLQSGRRRFSPWSPAGRHVGYCPMAYGVGVGVVRSRGG